MRGRATFIALACVALVAAPVGSAAARRGGGPRGRVNGKPTLPTGCSHGGAPFVTHGPRGRKRIAIGFDDGPSDYTPQVLRVLRRFDSHATFFEIGQETAGRVSTMRKIIDIAEYDFLRFRINSDNREFRVMTGGPSTRRAEQTATRLPSTRTKAGQHAWRFTIDRNVGGGEFGILPPGTGNATNGGKIYTFAITE